MSKRQEGRIQNVVGQGIFLFFGAASKNRKKRKVKTAPIKRKIPAGQKEMSHGSGEPNFPAVELISKLTANGSPLTTV